MAKKHIICGVGELPAGARKIVQLGSRSVGIFNVDGELYAFLNRCPHKGAELCEGPLCGTNAPVDGYSYQYTNAGRILRCARHGWEFCIETGKCFSDPAFPAKMYPVSVEDGKVVVTT